MQFYLLKRSWVIPDGDVLPYVYTPEEVCDSSTGPCNNAKGGLRGPYFNNDIRSVNPFFRYRPCNGIANAIWWCMPGSPNTVTMTVGIRGYACGTDKDAGYPIDPHTGFSWSHSFKKTGLPLDWYTGDVTLDDFNDPSSGVTLTVSQCPESFDPFPPETERVRFNVIFETKWEPDDPWHYTYCFTLEGNELCGKLKCNSYAPATAGYYYTDNGTIAFNLGFDWYDACVNGETYNESSRFELESYEACIPFDDGNWLDSLELPNEEVVAYTYTEAGGCMPYARLTIERADPDSPCPECSGIETPPEEDETCNGDEPCLEIFVPVDPEEGTGYQSQCYLGIERISPTEFSYVGDCAAPEEFTLPSGNGALVEVTMLRDETASPENPPTGSKTFRVTITVKDAVTGDVIDEHTFIVTLVCNGAWSIYDVFEITGYDPEYTGPTTLEIRIGAKCSGVTLTPPEECDPGCWPECVMCPERKTLYVVVSDAPDCCLSGAYALTWVGTGGGGAPTVGYYKLPAPVGGPIGTCGQITFLTVSCLDATHINVQLIYLRAEGTEISTYATLSVICDGSGHLESDAIHVPGRSGDRESLCGFDDTVGGDIRIVSD